MMGELPIVAFEYEGIVTGSAKQNARCNKTERAFEVWKVEAYQPNLPVM